jgi:ureidoacrylate peracid hydrolase
MNVPQLTTADTALLLIDLQNGFVDPRGFVARDFGGLSPSLRAAVGAARRLLLAARDAGIPVIHTQHAFEHGYRDGGFLVQEIMPKRAGDGTEPSHDLVVGSWEAEFAAPVAPLDGEHIISKNRYDAFIGTRLERLLHRDGIRTLIVGGVVTTVCVESTIRDAAMRDFRVYLAADAVGDIDEDAHAQGVARLSRNFAHALTVADARQAWGAVPVAA